MNTIHGSTCLSLHYRLILRIHALWCKRLWVSYKYFVFCRLFSAILQCSFIFAHSFTYSPWVLEPIIDVPFCTEEQKYVFVAVIYVSRIFHHFNFLGVNCIFTVTHKLQYRATGRGFVVHQIKFADYRLNLRSHFIKAQVIQVDSLDEGMSLVMLTKEFLNHMYFGSLSLSLSPL